MRYPFLRITILAIFILCGSTYFGCTAESTKDTSKELFEQIELFSDTISIIEADYVEDTNPKDLVYGALYGMLSSLDDYSQFLDPESFSEMEVDTQGEFGGLGIEIGMRDGVLTVVAPMDGTPADKAGIEAGDRVVKIDDELTRDMTMTQAVGKLRGKPGTEIKLTVLREDEEKLIDFVIKRDIIKINSIKMARMLKDKVGYVKLVEFQKNTTRELEEKLLNLKKENMQALILDLRNNPGGLLETANEVADIFLPNDKIIVTLKGRSPKQNKVYKARAKRKFLGFPMVVLVNKGSASGSEIVAGAIRDNKRGVLVGTQTFGKGSVQTVIPLKDGSAVRITTAAYYTPSGQNIMHKGIAPDVEVKYVKTKEEPDKKDDIFKKVEGKNGEKPEEEKAFLYDNQIEAALDVLKGIMIYSDQRLKTAD